MGEWESTVAGVRMVVDQEFADRVRASPLSSQQWNLVMTAVSFEIENPGTPADARIVADTSRLPAVMDEIRSIGEGVPSGSRREPGVSGGGLLSGVLSSLGISSSSEDETYEEAVRLADEYAEQLQAKLVERGRWESTCEQAAAG